QPWPMRLAADKARILVVDDDERIRRICTTFLTKIGHQVTAADSAQSAMREICGRPLDILLTDIRMPDVSGSVLIDRLQQLKPELAAVIMTGYPTMELAIEAVGKGVYEFLTKPFKLTELQAAVDRVMERQAAAQSRIQRGFADRLLDMEKELGGEFDLHRAIDTLLGPPRGLEPEAPEEPTGAPTPERPGGRAVTTPVAAARLDPAQPLFVVLCEPIPRDRNVLRTAANYSHFRTIYAAHRVLNAQLAESQLGVEVKMVMASHSADIPRHFRRYPDQICCVIFGPNLARLTEATVRMAANASQGRHVVVCYNPDQVNFTWDQLEELSGRINVWGCRGAADAADVRNFWSRYFSQELRPLVESKVQPRATAAGNEGPLSVEEIRERLARDQAAADLLPGFPHICRQVIDAIDTGKRYAEVATIIQPDGALQASIVRTANLARYGSRQRIESLPNALSMVGAEETKKIAMGRAMSDLMKRVDQGGFSTRDFFHHSTSVGYLAQLLSLNLESPSTREREIVESLRLPNLVSWALRQARLWERFAGLGSFDAFTAGILHDAGKVLNTVCYEGVFPMILSEYERCRWQGGLLACEISVVGDLQHPATGGALLERWDIFPDLIEPIRGHHRIDGDSRPESVLLAVANCLAKGPAPFPRAIAIPDEYRRRHLNPVEDPAVLENPLIAAYRDLTEAFGAAQGNLTLSPEEVGSGQLAPEHVESMLAAAREAVAGSAAAATYTAALADQSPEFPLLAERLQTTAGSLLALGLVLQGFVNEVVSGLFQGTRARK
ncbi:MAG: HDOD domain-containing protein, partial [Gemmatimonadota bacterium]